MLSSEDAIALLEATLQQQLKGVFNTIARRHEPLAGLKNLPALFITHAKDHDTYSGQGLPRTMLELWLWVYAKVPKDPTKAPDTTLNNLKAAIRNVFAPDNDDTNEFTLGDAVAWCRIEGTTDFYPGDLGEYAKMIVPVTMLLTI